MNWFTKKHEKKIRIDAYYNTKDFMNATFATKPSTNKE